MTIYLPSVGRRTYDSPSAEARSPRAMLKTALSTLAKHYIPFTIPATELAAGTPTELISPVAGTITRLRTSVQTLISTGGDITVEVNTVAVDGLTIAVANAAAVGTRQTDTPTAAHATAVVAEGDRIEIIPSAAFTGGGALSGYIEITEETIDPDD